MAYKREGERYLGGKYHGTRTGYRKVGCRCEPCRKWNAEYQADLTNRNAAWLVDHFDEIEHGRVYVYKQFRCRCEACTQANAKDKQYRRLLKALGL